MGSSRQRQEGRTSTGPWQPAQGALRDAIPQIQDAYNTERGWQPYGDYSGSAIAGFTGDQSRGMDQIRDIAQSGGGVTQGALGMVGDTLSGHYLDAGNPHFGLMAGRIRDQVQPQLTAQWSRAGRGTGNEEAPRAISQGVGDAVGALAYQNYGDERGRMMQAAGMAPGLDAARYADAERLYGVGQLQQQMDQSNIDDQIYQSTYRQQQGSNALDQQLRRLQGIGSMGQEGSSSSTTTSQMSPMQMMAGAGMTGLGLMSGNPMMGMGGMGSMFSPGTAANGGWSTTTTPASRWGLPWMQ